MKTDPSGSQTTPLPPDRGAQPPVRHQHVPIEPLVRDPGHCFFGYYDLQPEAADGGMHLAHRAPFMDRIPTAGERVELGTIGLESGAFTSVASTEAWNFQQGAMLQWNPRNPNAEILYNIRRDHAYGAAIRNLHTGAVRTFDRPVATVSADGATALSVDFSRLLDFRPGYGYAGVPDARADIPAPEDHGIDRLDLVSGGVTPILSLASLREHFVSRFGAAWQKVKVLINHITLNPSASRFLFLLRSMAMPGQPAGGWLTMVGTADLDGRDVHIFNGHGGASHYCWRDDSHVLIYADRPGRGDMQLCLVTDQTQQFEILDAEVFTFDGHCSYSPDRRFLLYDSYPSNDHYRKLLVYDTVARRAVPLAELYSVPTPLDARCDLHPRWSRDGSHVSFDSTHEGFRSIYRADVQEVCRGG